MRSAPGNGERRGSGLRPFASATLPRILVAVREGVDPRVGVWERERDDGDAAAVVADHVVVAYDHSVGADGEDARAGWDQADDVLARQDGFGRLLCMTTLRSISTSSVTGTARPGSTKVTMPDVLPTAVLPRTTMPVEFSISIPTVESVAWFRSTRTSWSCRRRWRRRRCPRPGCPRSTRSASRSGRSRTPRCPCRRRRARRSRRRRGGGRR